MVRPLLFRPARGHSSGIVFEKRCFRLGFPPVQRHIRAITSDAGAQLSHQQLRRMEKFVDRLLEQNKVMNLTAIKSPGEAWERHVQDSISLLPAIETCLHGNARPAHLIDVGSGAGIPGLILAIARPEWQVLLLDSIKKRCNFVEDAVRHLGLTNVDVMWSRAESAARQAPLREAFDVAVARAVAEMRTLAELSLPLVKIGGHLIAAKGPNPEEEVSMAQRAISLMGGSLVEISPVDSFGPHGQRTVIVVKKVKATPNAYPRDNGLPKKNPL